MRGGVGDRAREHPVDPKRGVAQLGRGGDPPAARLEPDEAAAGGGDADRAAAVVAMGDRKHARWRRPPPRPRRSRRAYARRSHGLRVGPKMRASLTGRMPYSGSVVVPTITNPASFRRRVTLWS